MATALLSSLGGAARYPNNAAAEVVTLENGDLDWLGLYATRLNGHLLLTIFRELARRVMVTNPDDVLDMPA
jgi:uridylate kinase